MNAACRALLTVCSIAVVAVVASAQTPEELFRKANDDYRNSRYEEAAHGYRAVLDSGVESAEIYFNLGNASFRLGRIADAILAFERAHRLDPLDDDIEHNLNLARLRTADRIDPLPELFIVTWLRALNVALPLPVTRIAFLAVWSGLFLALVGLFLVRNPFVIRLARGVFFFAVVAALLLGLLLAIQSLAFTEERSAIVRARTVTAKSSPDAGAVDAFVIHEGLKVRLSDELEGWKKVTLPDGKVGWVMGEEVEEI